MQLINLPIDIICEISKYFDIYDLYKMKSLCKYYYDIYNIELKKRILNNCMETTDIYMYKNTLYNLTDLEFGILLCIINAINYSKNSFSISIINTFINKNKYKCIKYTKFGSNTISILLYCKIRINHIEYILTNSTYKDKKIQIYDTLINVDFNNRRTVDYIKIMKNTYNTIEEDLQEYSKKNKLCKENIWCNKETEFTMITYSFY